MNIPAAQPGSILADRYRIDRIPNPKEPGSALICTDLRRESSRVVLRILKSAADGTDQAAKLRLMYSQLARLAHPGLARVIDLGPVGNDGDFFLAEEHVSGSDIFSAAKAWDQDRVLEVLAQVCRVLHYLHAHGILHGRLTSDHILITGGKHDPETIRITGYGLMPWMLSKGHSQNIRDLAYVAPEVLLGQVPGARADLYSMGILCYQLLSRRMPFEKGQRGYLVQKHLQGNPDMRPILRLESGMGLAQAIRMLMDKNPDNRPSTAWDAARLLSVACGRKLFPGFDDVRAEYFAQSPLVGREGELQKLREVAGQVQKSGRGWTVFVMGESGCGKSRIMEEFRTWAVLEGWKVAEGRCQLIEGPSYGPFRELLEWEAAADDRHDSMGEIPFKFPTPPVDRSAGAVEMTTEAAAGQFRDTLTRELVRRWSVRPTVVLLHDFHRADKATVTVLDYLMSDVMSHPILICVSVRSAESEQAAVGGVMKDTIRQLRAETLPLEPLSERAIQEQIKGMTGDRKLAERIGATIHAAGGGNPFFTEEILKHLADRGTLKREESGWCVRESQLESLETPAEVAAVLKIRLGMLPPDAKLMADWLAVTGRAVTLQFLRSATGFREEMIRVALDELLGRQILRAIARDGLDYYDFRHSLTAEVILGALPEKSRRKMHRCIAEILEGQLDPHTALVELAGHFIQGRCDAKAVDYALKAAAACRAEFAHESALHFYEYALRFGRHLSEEERCIAAMEAADVCCSLGLASRAIEILIARYENSQQIGVLIRAKICAALSIAFRYKGDLHSTAATASKGLELLKSCSDVHADTNGTLLASLAYCSLIKSDNNKALSFLAKALKCYHGNAKSITAGRIYALMSAAKKVSGDLAGATLAAIKSIEILSDQNAQDLLPIAFSHFALCQAAEGRFKAALYNHEKAITFSQKTRSVIITAQTLVNKAETLCRSGDVETAWSIIQEANQMTDKLQNQHIIIATKITTAEILLNKGYFENARELLSTIVDRKEQNLPLYLKCHSIYLYLCVLYECRDHISFHKWYLRLKSFEKKDGDHFPLKLADILKAKLLISNGKFSKAIDKLLDIRKHIIFSRNAYLKCIVSTTIAEALLSADDLTKVSKYLNESIRLSHAMPSLRNESYARYPAG